MHSTRQLVALTKRLTKFPSKPLTSIPRNALLHLEVPLPSYLYKDINNTCQLSKDINNNLRDLRVLRSRCEFFIIP